MNSESHVYLIASIQKLWSLSDLHFILNFFFKSYSPWLQHRQRTPDPAAPGPGPYVLLWLPSAEHWVHSVKMQNQQWTQNHARQKVRTRAKPDRRQKRRWDTGVPPHPSLVCIMTRELYTTSAHQRQLNIKAACIYAVSPQSGDEPVAFKGFIKEILIKLAQSRSILAAIQLNADMCL